MRRVAIVARVTVHEGRVDQYVAAFAPLLQQVEGEAGTLLYAVHRSTDDPLVFWTTEIYADEAAFRVHSSSDAQLIANRVFPDLIAHSDFMIAETLMAKGLDI